jgi:hypothetical protein
MEGEAVPVRVRSRRLRLAPRFRPYKEGREAATASPVADLQPSKLLEFLSTGQAHLWLERGPISFL